MTGNISNCTVVMATYNGSKYLEEQLASLERQVMHPDRLIASDDGSTDSTREILSAFAKEASFDVVIVDGPRQGYAENLWSAAKLVETKYLAWADQDDVWHPQKILRCVQVLEETGASFVSHSAAVVDESLRPLGHSLPDYPRTRVMGPLKGDPFEVPAGRASVFQREILDDVDWASRPLSHQHLNQLPHDHVVPLIVFAFHRRVQLAESLACYRQHGSNVAGDPIVRGFARISESLKVSAGNYAELASAAEGYARYLSLIAAGDTSAVGFYLAAAERARCRGRLRDGETVLIRLRALVDSVRTGNYRTKDNGGFGLPALLNDSFSLCLSLAEGYGYRTGRKPGLPSL